ncbi:MAG: hypothetical protein HYX69_19965 [Planctomycetia bacterium]|nr:hypothetical protein [Planctomycetia bacterium]
MSAVKRAEPAKPAAKPPPSQLALLLRGPLRWLLSWGLVIAILGGAGYAGWRAIAPTVLHQEQYRLVVDNLVITRQPAWIHADVRRQAFDDGGFAEGTWIHDDDLAERIAKAFAVHAWVAKVERVTKRAPARVEVDLVYRRPVLMVEVPGVPGGVFPVDAEGVLLPVGDFLADEARRYPRLSGVTTLPAGGVGLPWGDLHVAGGAEVAAALLDAWEELPLDHIAVSGAGTPGILFELVPRNEGGRAPYRVIWGHAPSTREPGEPEAAQKVARLREFIAAQSRSPSSGAPPELDLRYTPAHRTARGSDPAEKLKQ